MTNHNPMTNEQLIKAIIFGIICFMVLFTIAIYGMEAEVDKQNKEFQKRIADIDQQQTAREAAREEEWAETRRELHEYFNTKKMEEVRTKIEEIHMSDDLIQEEIYEVINVIKVPETAKEETDEPETIMEVTEDDIIESQIFFEEPDNVSEEGEMPETEQIQVEVEMTEAETKPEEVESEISEEVEGEMTETETKTEEVITDDWFEPQPMVEQQPEVKQIPEPSMTEDNDVPLIYSLQDFYSWNGIDQEYFLVKLACVVYAESRGTCREGKVSVAASICNWARSGLKTSFWDILSGYAPIDGVDYYKLWWDPIEGETMKSCREAAEAAVNGEDPAGEMMGVHTFYFLDPAKSTPRNVAIMTKATHQVWIGQNQLFLGAEGVRWW